MAVAVTAQAHVYEAEAAFDADPGPVGALRLKLAQERLHAIRDRIDAARLPGGSD